MSRPETPLSRRSSAVSVPTFVRGVGAEPGRQLGDGVGPRRPGRVRRRRVVGGAVGRPVASNRAGS